MEVVCEAEIDILIVTCYVSCNNQHIADRLCSEAMIQSFRCRETEALFKRERSRRFGAIERQARRKLLMLDAACVLDDLRSPPGNRLEALRGDRAGAHSIRINDQWRLCFVWAQEGPQEVEIVDYH